MCLQQISLSTVHEGPEDWKRSVWWAVMGWSSLQAFIKTCHSQTRSYHRNISAFALQYNIQSASRSHHAHYQPLWVLSLHPSSPPRCSPNLPRLSWSAVLFELWRLPPIPHLLSLTFSVKTTPDQGPQLYALIAIGALCSCILMLCFLLLALYTLQKNLEGEARRTRPGTRACAVMLFISERASILIHSFKKTEKQHIATLSYRHSCIWLVVIQY